MRRTHLAVLGLVGFLGLVACGDPGTTNTSPGQTVPTDAGSLPDDEIADLETLVEDFANRVAESDAADEVRDAWNTLAAELMTAAESADEATAETRERLRAELDEFAETLNTIELEDEVRSAWDEFRARVEEAVD